MSLSYSDFRWILTQTGEPLTQEEVWEFFQIVDEDQDGMLHIEELMKVCCSAPSLLPVVGLCAVMKNSAHGT
jgi:Ca2+-binding EF-hand superfamily protein